jgi:hypothetical protein
MTMETVIQKPPDCPVCGKPTEDLKDCFHCGNVRLLRNVQDHYLSFKQLPKELPKKGCPICGKPMKNEGRFKWLFTGKEDGLDRFYCDGSEAADGHYCYVTAAWYMLNKRTEVH